MKFTRLIAVLATSAALVIGSTATATAADPGGAPYKTGVRTAVEEASRQKQKTKPVVATYEGKKIDLAKGWGGAEVCTEVAVDDVRCYDTVAESNKALAKIDAGHAALAKNSAAADSRAAAPETLGARAAASAVSTRAASDCPSGYVCVWEHYDYNTKRAGRLLKWSANGHKELSDWGFRDQASSACITRPQGGADLNDHRTGMPDPYLVLASKSCYNNFSKYEYTYGGNWNDRVDSIDM
ncbi:peptidase inhibitor family I36 protein [Streptomyces sp. MS1.AVA.4]|uniref:Peptidase inhibitor family I36 protein n=1 Tax=Streptomyces pratisoli TaxID=3139917 RepID=A0ACC6QL85_9ACTN